MERQPEPPLDETQKAAAPKMKHQSRWCGQVKEKQNEDDELKKR